MKVNVYMLAFGQPGEVRHVEIEPASNQDCYLLEQVFQAGQNDFQPQNHPSVSVGDVIELNDGRLFVVRPFGFKEITTAEFNDYQKLPRRDRQFSTFVDD